MTKRGPCDQSSDQWSVFPPLIHQRRITHYYTHIWQYVNKSIIQQQKINTLTRMLFVVAACLLSTVSAARYCCTPPQWEGDMGIIVGSSDAQGQGSLTEGSMRISYDSIRKIIATQQSLYVNGAATTQTVIDNYNDGTSFVLKSDGSCVRGVLGAWVPNCIPDNATEANIRYGLGDDTVQAKAYMINYGEYDVYFAVTSDTCVPLAEDVTGMFNGVGVFEVITFSNVKAGIQDYSVFDVPAKCVSSPLVQVPGFTPKRSSPFS